MQIFYSEPVDPDELVQAIEEAELETENILKHDNNCLENYTSHDDSLTGNFDLINGIYNIYRKLI